ncbi:MAG: sigma-70 family RNA polymerase sigma factor [Nitrospirales bacterium]|nr:sigma-70 family RNA polymerase sigma factor [Nitrospirales bacterium]
MLHTQLPVPALGECTRETEQSCLRALHADCHEELVHFVTQHVKSPHLATDIAQEAFVRLLRHKDLRTIRHLKTYLFQIAINLAKDHYRTHACHVQALQEVELQHLPRVDIRTPETIALAKEQLRQINEALGELSPLCQRIFYLNRIQGLKHREIAERLAVSKRTVEENLKRALSHCLARVDSM